MPLHDKALLKGICKHGIGRHDLMIMDKELPFHEIVEKNIENSDNTDPSLQSTSAMLIRIAWPKELVIARRIEALCELILKPKPQKRSRSRKPKLPAPAPNGIPSTSSAMERSSAGGKTIPPRVGGKTIAASMIPPPHVANRRYLSDVETDSDEEEEEDEEDDRQKRVRYDIQQRRIPTKPLKSQGLRHKYPSFNTPVTTSTSTSNSSPDYEMEEGEISDSDNEQHYHY